MSNNEQVIKLYSEEQVKTMLNRARIFHGHVGDNFVYILSNVEILSAEIPIELPSDEEICKEAHSFYKLELQYKAFIQGAKSLRDKIGGNK